MKLCALPMLLALSACQGETSAPPPAPAAPTEVPPPPATQQAIADQLGPRPAAVAAAQAQSISLSQIDFAELTFSENNRPGGAVPPVSIPIKTPWRYGGTTKAGMHRWITQVPIRPRGLFFNKAQPGMVLRQGEEAVRYDRFGKSTEPMWTHDRHDLFFYTEQKIRPASDGTITLSYPKAIHRERALNYALSDTDQTQAGFVRASVQSDWESRQGLYLPAPAHASFRLELPPAAELHMAPGLVPPELLDATASDGATLEVEIEANGARELVHSQALTPGAFPQTRIDLSKWSGQEIVLHFTVKPGANNTFDYAFIGEPTVSSRQEDPVKVVMIFIDTLRPDHMSLFGYERDTTAALDPLKSTATLFTNTRSIAPWTLPSAMSVVTGRQPEYYGRSETLQGTLSRAGWATAFLAGNVYLSAQFDIDRDWDLHRVGLWPSAEEITNDALRWLDQHEGRDTLLQVHYMDAHLPYLEPEEYRHQYAGDSPKALREQFHVSDVRKLEKRFSEGDRQYIQDRYDNNIRYATDQIARLVEKLDDNDILVLYADHGEEFWDHNGFEHGHTVFDELLRVPLVIKAPGLPPGTIDAPTSLLDITPTILELTQRAPLQTDGSSLVALAQGDPKAAKSFEGRDLAFGRPLYGSERWGVLDGQKKWMVGEGREALYDLSKDPSEQDNLLVDDKEDRGEPYRALLGEVLGREVGEAWRFAPTPTRGKDVPELWAMCTVPGGVKHAWLGSDPMLTVQAEIEVIDDPDQLRKQLKDHGIAAKDHPVEEGSEGLIMRWNGRGSREVFMIPSEPMGVIGYDVKCSAQYCVKVKGSDNPCPVATMAIPTARDPGLGELRIPLNRIRWGKQRTLLWAYGVAPIPSDETEDLVGQDPELMEALQAIGYATPDKED